MVSVLTSCASRHRPADPLTDLKNPSLPVPQRRAAMNKSWEMALAGTLDKTAVREDLKTVAWSRFSNIELRTTALGLLLSDTDDKAREDTRSMTRLMLPREPEPRVTTLLSAAAESNNWTDATPSLVRSLSIPWIGLSDRERPEARALLRLNPADSLERIAYSVFQNPPTDTGSFGLVTPEKVRSDAWNLLRRLDPDGAARRRLLAEDQTSPASQDIRASLADFKIMPETGEELAWLTSLRRNVSRDWWSRTSQVVQALPPEAAAHLRLRHLPVVRWAADKRPEWLSSSRDRLRQDLASRLDGRKTHFRFTREAGEPRPAPEKLSEWQSRLSWADVLSILVLDEAIHAPGVPEALFSQAAMDKDDRTAEYGGLVRADDKGEFTITLFPPRPGSRRGDNEFVASSDMFAQGDLALAHYHFHAQDTRNGGYAGPSPGDLAYAARHARTCLVFTWVASRTLNVDVYTPDGAVIDLGEVSKP